MFVKHFFRFIFKICFAETTLSFQHSLFRYLFQVFYSHQPHPADQIYTLYIATSLSWSSQFFYFPFYVPCVRLTHLILLFFIIATVSSWLLSLLRSSLVLGSEIWRNFLFSITANFYHSFSLKVVFRRHMYNAVDLIKT